jgi:hypothetical protein
VGLALWKLLYVASGCLEIPKNRELTMPDCRSAQIYKALKDVDEAIDDRGCGVSGGVSRGRQVADCVN